MENLKTVREILKNTEPAGLWQYSCTTWRTFFSCVIKKQIFCFQIYAYGREKYNVPIATENLLGERLSRKRFSIKFGEIRASYSSHPKKLPAPTFVNKNV